jgi:glyoxylase-like metal-dependent hydrolase (beta-lactamase superfamily II)
MTESVTRVPNGSHTVVAGIDVIDLEYLEQARSVASVIIGGAGRLAVLDPGPSTTLPILRRQLAERGASVDDIESILLTHIHLDHAGVTGTLVRLNPRIRVYVHTRGAAHVVDPSRLLNSATRIYGDEMQRLWGEVLPVPPESLRPLADDDTLVIVGRPMRAMYTPGHAWHHVSYLDEGSGVAFVGDTAGERFPGQQYVLPVTPPPDVDVDRWLVSSARIRAWRPSQLVITHFGAFPDAPRHLEEHESTLMAWATAVQGSLRIDRTDAERAEQFAISTTVELRRHLPAEIVARYQGSLRSSWDGLARYWRTRSAVTPGTSDLTPGS